MLMCPMPVQDAPQSGVDRGTTGMDPLRTGALGGLAAPKTTPMMPRDAPLPLGSSSAMEVGANAAYPSCLVLGTQLF